MGNQRSTSAQLVRSNNATKKSAEAVEDTNPSAINNSSRAHNEIRPTANWPNAFSADLPSGENGPVLFQIGGAAGVYGLTVFYPNQNIQNPVPYNYTFNIGNATWNGTQPGLYMAHSIINCTLLLYSFTTLLLVVDYLYRPAGR